MGEITEKVKEMLEKQKKESEEQTKKYEEKNMPPDTPTTPPPGDSNTPDIPFADDEKTQREISSVLWGIFILTFFTQVLTALMYLLTNPEATWKVAVVMIIMAAQGTLFGGAIKMLTKKLEWIQSKLDTEQQSVKVSVFEKTNFEKRIEMYEAELKRLNIDLDNSHAEVVAFKQKAFNTI